MKLIIALDGMDRTGKSTLGETNGDIGEFFSRALNRDVVSFNDHEGRYSSMAKSCFKDTSISPQVSYGIAIAELLEGLEFMTNRGADTLIMPRTFVSSLVYMNMRGDKDKALELFVDAVTILDKFGISMISYLLSINKSTMLQRGSELDSYEIVNYDEILKSMSQVVFTYSLPRVIMEILHLDSKSKQDVTLSILDRTRTILG